MIRRIKRIEFERYSRFNREFKKLPPGIREQAAEALTKLLEDPIPAALRFEKLKGGKKDIYTIHATKNHSHKVSFEIEGRTAVMRRIATHKKIDDSP